MQVYFIAQNFAKMSNRNHNKRDWNCFKGRL